MKKLMIATVLSLAVFTLGGCKITTSTNSNSSNTNSANSNTNANSAKAPAPNRPDVAPPKEDPNIKEQAKTISSSGEFSALEVATDTPKNTGGCTCAAKVAIMFQVPDKSAPAFRLCIGAGHKGVDDFAKIHSGDLIQFTLSDTALDSECLDNPGTYLRVKTGE